MWLPGLLNVLVLLAYIAELVSTCPDAPASDSWGEDQPKHYCGSNLSDTLFAVCQKSGFPSHFAPGSTMRPNKHRGIIDECCKNPCTKTQLSQYCQSKMNKSPAIPKKKKRREQNLDLKKNKNKGKKKRNSNPRLCPCAGANGRPKKKYRRNRKRSTFKTTKQRPTEMKLTTTTTTQIPAVPEAQYVDDWDGEPPFSLQSASPAK